MLVDVVDHGGHPYRRRKSSSTARSAEASAALLRSRRVTLR